MTAVFTTSTSPVADGAVAAGIGLAVLVVVAAVLCLALASVVASCIDGYREIRGDMPQPGPYAETLLDPAIYDWAADAGFYPETVTPIGEDEAMFFARLACDMPDRTRLQADWVALNDGAPGRHRWAR